MISVVQKGQEMSKTYIPKDIDDCFVELNKILEYKGSEGLKNGTENNMYFQHSYLGRDLRNEWGLWSGSQLSKWFNKKGIEHPDDMSGIILISYWRHLNSKPIKLEEQIKESQDYWEEVMPKPIENRWEILDI